MNNIPLDVLNEAMTGVAEFVGFFIAYSMVVIAFAWYMGYREGKAVERMKTEEEQS